MVILIRVRIEIGAPQNPHKKPGVGAHIYDPDAKKAETEEGSLADCSPACLRSSEPARHSVSNKGQLISECLRWSSDIRYPHIPTPVKEVGGKTSRIPPLEPDSLIETWQLRASIKPPLVDTNAGRIL